MNVSEKVAEYVKHHRFGSVFTHQQLVKHVGGHESRVSQSLKKLEEAQVVVHIDRGLWQRPKQTRFGVVLASPEQVASAIAKQRKAFLVEAGAKALNEIGASTQLPMKSVFIANKRIKPIKVGKAIVEFKHSRSFESAMAKLTGLSNAEKRNAAKLWVALDFAGKEHVLREQEAFLESFRNLSPKAQKKLLSTLEGKLRWAMPILGAAGE